MDGRFHGALLALFCVPLLFTGCKVQPPPRSVPITVTTDGNSVQAPQGIAGEIQRTIETGSPRSLATACAQLQDRNLKGTDFGRLMNAVAAALFRAVYPDIPARYLPPDPPLTSAYTRILRYAERGIYTPPQLSPAGQRGVETRDFLECVLPFLAFYYAGQLPGQAAVTADSGKATPKDALPALERAAALNADSALPWLFTALVYEGEGDAAGAEAAYREALQKAEDCYPAELGLVRLMDAGGEKEAVLARLLDLLIRYPDNIAVKKELTRHYVARGDWNAATPLMAEILQHNPHDGEFLLLRAKTAMEQGRWQDAAASLDAYALIDSGSREYLFLRARFQAEYGGNRESAFNYLRSILRKTPDDTAVQAYMAGLLLESPVAAQADEGRAILNRLLAQKNPPPETLSLAVRDAIRREAWREAERFLERLIAVRRNSADLFDGYRVERGLGNNSAALAYARELYNRQGNSDEAAAAYINALIDTGRRAEAERVISQKLAAATSGAAKSRYYYLRSRLETSDDMTMNDLRSSLFEDPRNLDALISLFTIYHRQGDIRRAAYYLKQAIAVSPNHAALRRYDAEYRARLGPNY